MTLCPGVYEKARESMDEVVRADQFAGIACRWPLRISLMSLGGLGVDRYLQVLKISGELFA
jgi:hypothetical protein